MACFGNSLICKSYVYDESFAQINGTIRVNMMVDSQPKTFQLEKLELTLIYEEPVGIEPLRGR